MIAGCPSAEIGGAFAKDVELLRGNYAGGENSDNPIFPFTLAGVRAHVAALSASGSDPWSFSFVPEMLGDPGYEFCLDT